MRIVVQLILSVLLICFFSCSGHDSDLNNNSSGIEQLENSPYEKMSFIGSLEEIDKYGSKLIYRVPFDERETGEYIEGSLYLYDKDKMSVDTLADTTLMEFASPFFKNDSIIVIPTQVNVFEYNFLKKTYSTFYHSNNKEYILDVNYNEEKSTYALLVLNDSVFTFDLLLLDINGEELFRIPYKYNFEFWGGYAYGDLMWIEDNLIYAIEDRLFFMNIEDTIPEIIDKDLYYGFNKPLYSVLGNDLFFCKENNDDSFDFIRSSIISNTPDNISTYSYDDIISMQTTRYFGNEIITLNTKTTIYRYDEIAESFKSISDTVYSVNNLVVTRSESLASWNKFHIWETGD